VPQEHIRAWRPEPNTRGRASPPLRPLLARRRARDSGACLGLRAVRGRRQPPSQPPGSRLRPRRCLRLPRSPLSTGAERERPEGRPWSKHEILLGRGLCRQEPARHVIRSSLASSDFRSRKVSGVLERHARRGLRIRLHPCTRFTLFGEGGALLGIASAAAVASRARTGRGMKR
jgi:hypothetical protein